ncbi:TPA: NAD-dependent epimerase/dehydratase family protein [Streptococcus agalactiae]
MMIKFSNKIVQEDLALISNQNYINWERIANKGVLISGSNSMLASYMVFLLAYLNETRNYQTQIIATARNIEKSRDKFSDLVGKDYFTLIPYDVEERLEYDGKVDYIIHAASNASPTAILSNPVSIIKANTIGTLNLLDFAKEKTIENFLFLSTREVYGTSIKEVIDEEAYGGFDILATRACYPESKRMAETLLQSYYDQYKVPFTIARIAHSFGPGMELGNDGRIMNDLLSNVIDGKDIVLKSSGTAERAFCYLADAVSGLFTILLNGEVGQAYNVANEDQPIMIKDLAQKLVDLFSDKNISVVFDIPKTMSAGYSKMGRTRLTMAKLEALGWKREVSLESGILKTVQAFEE